jgi:polyvinyl alcohol dehydrogenase (cytochrome)
MRLVSVLVFAVSVPAFGQAQNAPNPDAEALYKSRCASCHDAGVARAANRETLRSFSPDAIRLALTSGSMRTQGADLTTTQVDALARLLGGATAATAPRRADNACPAGPAAFANPLEQPNWNGWGANVSQHRFQPAGMAQLPAGDVPRLKLKWAFGFPGVNRAPSQPTVAGGRLFVGSAANMVYSLNANTGCQYWAVKTDAPVRTAISIGRIPGAGAGRWVAHFGDQAANAYAVDALSGEVVWKVKVENFLGATITGAPTLADETLYVVTSSGEEVIGANAKYECCKFRGSVSALNAATGEVRWKSFTIPETPVPVRKNKQGVQLWGPSGAGVWSSPAVDLKRGAVYVTTGDSYSDPAASTSDAFVAFDIKTGKLLWSRQTTAGDAFTIDCGLPEAARTNCPEANGPDFDFGSSPILIDLPGGGRALVAGQKSGVVHGIDPDRNGAILWQTRVGKGSALGGVQWGSAFDGRRVYVALSDVQPEPVPAGTSGGQPTAFGLPMRLNNRTGGGLFALNPATGAIVWNTPHPGCGERPGCSPAQSAAVTAIPGVVFSGGLDGHLRAYASETGAIVWDVDTAQPYETVNGVKANGGSLDGPGPVVVGGMLFVNSGYAFVGGMPGNVLLAFSVDGK